MAAAPGPHARARWAGAAMLLAGILAVFVPCRMARLEGWDDAFYLAQLTSVIGDGDLRLHDDLLAFDNPFPLRFRLVTFQLPGGGLGNSFGIGPAVVHSAYTWPLLMGERPRPMAFRAALALGSLILLVLTVLLTARVAQQAGVSSLIAHVAAALAVFWGPLAVYGTRSYLGSHLAAAFLAAALTTAVLAWHRSGAARHAIFAGLCAGLLAATRWQDVLFPLAFVPLLLARRPGGPPLGRALLAAVATFAVVFSVQLLAFEAQFGRLFFVPQGSHFMSWTSPALRSFLLSPFHGALPWAPGFMLGLAGVALLPRSAGREWRALGHGLLGVVAVFIYMSAVPVDWWAGDSFGPRRLSTLTPVAGLGLALILRALPPRPRIALVVVLSAWSVVLISAFLSGYDDLAVLFAGRTAADNPLPAAHYAGRQWIDDWGVLHALKPGFTFADAPRNADRLVGLAVVGALVAAAAAAFRLVTRSARAQRVVIALGLAWCALWSARLALVVPSNRPTDALWREVIRGGPATGAALPASTAAAADVVLAVHALERGDRAAAEQALARAGDRHFPAFELATLEAFLQEPAHRAAVRALRSENGSRPGSSVD